MNPARYTAAFTMTTIAATSDGVIDGKDIMYVFKTGRKPESPNPATSNPTLVIAPSPKKKAMLPKMTTAQLVHSKCFRHVARVARTPNTITPATPLNGSSDARRLAFSKEVLLPCKKSGTNERYIWRIHEVAKMPNPSFQVTGIARTLEREFCLLAGNSAAVVFSSEPASGVFRPMNNHVIAVPT